MNFPSLANINKIMDDVSDISSSDDEEIDTSFFTDDNPDFVDFKNNVKEWVTLDDDIKTLQKAMTERKKRKNELTPTILKFMSDYKVNDLNTQNGQIKFVKSVSTKPLNKQYLISRLSDFFKDLEKGEKAATFLLENRDKEEKFRLKRVMGKKNINV